MATKAITKKRRQVSLVIDTFIKGEPSIDGVAVVGSVALGTAATGSDIDAVVFMHPIDRYILPTESIWCPWDNSFHSIFVPDQRVHNDGIQLDLEYLDTRHWSDDQFDWPEEYRAALADSWIAYDRRGTVAQLVAKRTEYDDEIRLERLDKFVLTLEGELGRDIPETNWARFSPFVCAHRLNAVYDAIVAALFAYNRRWRFHPEREAQVMLRFGWLPDDFEARMLRAGTASSIDRAGILERVEHLRDLSHEILQKLASDGLYGSDPASEAFIRRYDEPGRSWNMDAWNENHAARQRDESAASR
jgi:hypothetical protein